TPFTTQDSASGAGTRGTSVTRTGIGGRSRTTPAPSARACFRAENMEHVTHVLDDLDARGLIAHSTDRDALRAALDEGPVTYYVGFDPTAPSLHIGNLLQILTARR